MNECAAKKVWCVSVGCLTLFICSFLAAGTLKANSEAQVLYDRSSSIVVLEYSRTHDLLGPDQALTVRVFGNGDVEIVVPSAYSQSGTYSFALHPDELDSLISSVTSSMITAQSSPSALAIAVERSNYLIADETHTRLQINVEQILEPDGSIVNRTEPMEMIESNLGQWRRQTPNLTYRRNLLDIETLMLSIANDTRRRSQ